MTRNELALMVEGRGGCDHETACILVRGWAERHGAFRS